MEKREKPGLTLSVLCSLGMTFVFEAAIAFLLPLLFQDARDPAGAAGKAAYVMLALGAIACGAICARLHGERGVLCGLAAGGGFVLTVSVVGAAAWGIGNLPLALVLCAGMLLLSAAAGRLARPKRKGRRRGR